MVAVNCLRVKHTLVNSEQSMSTPERSLRQTLQSSLACSALTIPVQISAICVANRPFWFVLFGMGSNSPFPRPAGGHLTLPADSFSNLSAATQTTGLKHHIHMVAKRRRRLMSSMLLQQRDKP